MKARGFHRVTAVFVATLAILAAASGCAPDPYNLHPQIYRIEKAVVGESFLEREKPLPHRLEYTLLEGTRIKNGGINYKVFRLRDIKVTPDVGNAILARKVRYGEIFGLLARGAVGEGANGEIIPRVTHLELTRAEMQLIDAENRDRDLLVKAAMDAKRVPPYEDISVRRVFSYARYQLLPEGIWVEVQPGKWVVKGGAVYGLRTLENPPVEVPGTPRPLPRGAGSEAPPLAVEPDLLPDAGTADVLEEAVLEEAAPVVLEEPVPTVK